MADAREKLKPTRVELGTMLGGGGHQQLSNTDMYISDWLTMKPFNRASAASAIFGQTREATNTDTATPFSIRMSFTIFYTPTFTPKIIPD